MARGFGLESSKASRLWLSADAESPKPEPYQSRQVRDRVDLHAQSLRRKRSHADRGARRAVPTEDAYVFAWDFVAILARYGRGQYALEEAGPGPEWLSWADFASAAAGPMQEVSLGARAELLPLLTPEVVEVALRRMDRGAFAVLDRGWQVIWPLLGDLSFRFRVAAGATEMAFDSHGARKYGPEFLTSFAWLYLNALLRECRQVDPSLPQLSRYF